MISVYLLLDYQTVGIADNAVFTYADREPSRSHGSG